VSSPSADNDAKAKYTFSDKYFNELHAIGLAATRYTKVFSMLSL